MTMKLLASRLRRCRRGAMAIETALVAPVLVVLALGTFEAGTMVSRQQELQSAASEAEGIILAAAATPTGADSGDIEDIIEQSMGLEEEQVTLSQRFRCNAAEEMVTDGTTCDDTLPIYRYVRVVLTDTYAPAWTHFGIGEGFDYNVERTILVQ